LHELYTPRTSPPLYHSVERNAYGRWLYATTGTFGMWEWDERAR